MGIHSDVEPTIVIYFFLLQWGIYCFVPPFYGNFMRENDLRQEASKLTR